MPSKPWMDANNCKDFMDGSHLYFGGMDANCELRKLLYDNKFYVQAFSLSLLDAGKLKPWHEPCGPMADWLEENGYSDFASVFWKPDGGV